MPALATASRTGSPSETRRFAKSTSRTLLATTIPTMKMIPRLDCTLSVVFVA